MRLDGDCSDDRDHCVQLRRCRREVRSERDRDLSACGRHGSRWPAIFRLVGGCGPGRCQCACREIELECKKSRDEIGTPPPQARKARSSDRNSANRVRGG